MTAKLNPLSRIESSPRIDGLVRFQYNYSQAEGEQLGSFEILDHQAVESIERREGEIPILKTHPVADQVLGATFGDGTRKNIAEIPIRLYFGKAAHTLRARYRALDAEGRAVCQSGSTQETASVATRRLPGDAAVTQHACIGPSECAFASQPGFRCDLQVRMRFQIRRDGVDPAADLDLFEFQSSGINTYSSLKGTLDQLEDVFGSLRGLELTLGSFSKSTMAVLGKPIHVAKLSLPPGKTLLNALDNKAEHFAGLIGLNWSAVDERAARAAESVDSLDAVEHVAIPSATQTVAGSVAFDPSILGGGPDEAEVAASKSPKRFLLVDPAVRKASVSKLRSAPAPDAGTLADPGAPVVIVDADPAPSSPQESAEPAQTPRAPVLLAEYTDDEGRGQIVAI